MALALPRLVRKMQNWFLLGSRSPMCSLGNSPYQSAFDVCMLIFYQFSNGVIIWPVYSFLHLEWKISLIT